MAEVADRAVGVLFAKEGFPRRGRRHYTDRRMAGMDPGRHRGGNPDPLRVVVFPQSAAGIPQGTETRRFSRDGKVLAVEEEFEPRYIKERAVRVSIFLNVFDVHINRIPVTGSSKTCSINPGCFWWPVSRTRR